MQLQLLKEDNSDSIFSYISLINDAIRVNKTNSSLLAKLAGKVAYSAAIEASKNFLYHE